MKEDEVVVVFGREPVPGSAKTRLIPRLGSRAACDVYRHLLAYTLRTLSQETRRVMLWLTPDSDSQFLHDPVFRGRFEIYRQQGNDLGERMHFMFRSVFAAGLRRVVLVGSDCPELTGNHIDKAFAALSQRAVTVGPSQDGGYWLMGQAERPRDLFSEVPWGTGKVLEATREKLIRAEISYGELERLRDIDLPEDLAAFVDDYSGTDPDLMAIQMISAAHTTRETL